MKMSQVSFLNILFHSLSASCYYDIGIRINPVDGIHIQMRVEAESGGSSLEISGVTLTDQGTYVCQIANTAGTIESTYVLEVAGMHNFLCICMYVCT